MKSGELLQIIEDLLRRYDIRRVTLFEPGPLEVAFDSGEPVGGFESPEAELRIIFWSEEGKKRFTAENAEPGSPRSHLERSN